MEQVLLVWSIFSQTYFHTVSKAQAQVNNQDFCKFPKLSQKTLISAKVIPQNIQEAVSCLEDVTVVPILTPSNVSYFRKDIDLIGIPAGNEYRYSIGMAVSKNCKFHKCFFGGFSGEVITANTLDPVKQYNSSVALYARSRREPIEQGGYITLSREIKGFYIPSFCISTCTEAEIVWQQDNYQYSVSLPSSNRLRKVMEFANSMIDNQP